MSHTAADVMMDRIETATADAAKRRELEAEIERLRAALKEISERAKYYDKAAVNVRRYFRLAEMADEALTVNEQTTPKYGCGHPQIADQDGTLPECPFCAAQNR